MQHLTQIRKMLQRLEKSHQTTSFCFETANGGDTLTVFVVLKRREKSQKRGKRREVKNEFEENR